ncbi:Mut7-C RNAse domain-containing protein [Polyangium sp. 15x6]|uniref:Mut7-C RNAse domain-containing protein n=1 Tax=Polyangium sp. 15x6 TaxID=3042687 RepID=UPI00249AC6E5|nr:Mut7-C RNAse domain-containing protein [Polyangium sp. 15x6]MDI3291644.1 Mut7-C RNAse domain-containing protein [Polyangium sp. 15x6]
MEPRFFCDAMLGGLARWLRAAGYDAAFEQGIDDGVLVARAAETGRILLSSDGGIFERTTVREGHVRSLFVPRALGLSGELRFVLGAFSLPLLPPRCMTCGGALVELTKDEARDEAPPKTLDRIETFYRCEGCGKLLWRGSHWERIARVLAEAEAAARVR